MTTVLAIQLDGKTLWHWGQPNTGVPQLAYDVPVQIYDLDGDGNPEVYLSIEEYLLVLDGRTGKELRRLKLPDGLKVADCITFANLRGGPRARDIIIKDRYTQLWAYTDDWKLLWHWKPDKYKTCHQPTIIDIDGDGRDEVMGGYTMLDDNGHELWTMKSDKVDLARGHLDCCEIFSSGKKPEESRLVVSCCGANLIAMLDGNGKTLWDTGGQHYRVHRCRPHLQATFRVGRSRLTSPTRLSRKAPSGSSIRKASTSGSYFCGDSRHHRLIDWDGDGTDEILAGQEQRLLDGKGQCVLRFGPTDAFKRATPVPPDQDHEPFGLVGDLDGDERPEIILYSMKKILVYRSEKAAKVPSLKLGTGVNVTLY